MRTLRRPGDKARILRRLEGVRPDSPRRWGRMTAHQMICHLNDSFLAFTGGKPTSPVETRVPTAVVRWVALYLPVPWPAGIRTSPEIDQEIGGTKPADFDRDVAELRNWVEIVTARPRSFEWEEHPVFGRMSDAAWLRWSYLHMDHHLRQFGA